MFAFGTFAELTFAEALSFIADSIITSASVIRNIPPSLYQVRVAGPVLDQVRASPSELYQVRVLTPVLDD